jgi:hypothetical protein
LADKIRREKIISRQGTSAVNVPLQGRVTGHLVLLCDSNYLKCIERIHSNSWDHLFLMYTYRENQLQIFIMMHSMPRDNVSAPCCTQLWRMCAGYPTPTNSFLNLCFKAWKTFLFPARLISSKISVCVVTRECHTLCQEAIIFQCLCDTACHCTEFSFVVLLRPIHFDLIPWPLWKYCITTRK